MKTTRWTTGGLSACMGLALVLAAATPAFGIDEYRLDDGAGDRNIGTGGGPTGNPSKATGWLNRFTVEAGAETLTGIRIAFGGIPQNTSATAYLWGDFNQDGDPDDAFVLQSVTDPISNPNFLSSTNNFQLFDIPDTTLPVGTIFFAGAIVNNHADGQVLSSGRPARLDDDGTDSIPNYLPMNHSYIVGEIDPAIATIDPNNLDMADLPVELISNTPIGDGNWLVRLDAIPVPEPATAGLLAAGALLLLKRRG